MPTWTFGDRIRKVRSLTGLDQRQFAAALDVTSSALAAWETERGQPRNIVVIAKRVEDLTGIPASWMLDVAPPSDAGPHRQKLPLRSRGRRPSKPVDWPVGVASQHVNGLLSGVAAAA